MDDTWDKMGLELLLRLIYVGCRGQYETRLSSYKPLCCFIFKLSQFPAGAPTLLRLFLLFKGAKSLYFTYSIVNFTALNLQGITLLHLLKMAPQLFENGAIELQLMAQLNLL